MSIMIDFFQSVYELPSIRFQFQGNLNLVIGSLQIIISSVSIAVIAVNVVIVQKPILQEVLTKCCQLGLTNHSIWVGEWCNQLI